MESLGGYIATFCVGAALQYLSQFLKPKIKIAFWVPHEFLYRIPINNLPNPPEAQAQSSPIVAGIPEQPQTVFFLTRSIIIQNLGRERADWVDITHRRKPEFFQLHPALNYSETIASTGEHTIRIESLAPKEWLTIQFVSFTEAPELLQIRSAAGVASPLVWMFSRKLSPVVTALSWLLIIAGGGFCSYWILKGAIFVLRSIGAF